MEFAIVFQSTHPGRGATKGVNIFTFEHRFQSTHPGRGATWGVIKPLAGAIMFQSTHPGRGATQRGFGQIPYPGVSIHAPRAGCDDVKVSGVDSTGVSIHAPRAGCDR